MRLWIPIPVICLTGQVPTHMIGNDAFQEADTLGITRPCTKHNYLANDVNNLATIVSEAFYVATNGRPGPVLIDIPKDIQIAECDYSPSKGFGCDTYNPITKPKEEAIVVAVTMIRKGEKTADLCRRRSDKRRGPGGEGAAKVRRPYRLSDNPEP